MTPCRKSRSRTARRKHLHPLRFDPMSFGSELKLHLKQCRSITVDRDLMVEYIGGLNIAMNDLHLMYLG